MKSKFVKIFAIFVIGICMTSAAVSAITVNGKTFGPHGLPSESVVEQTQHETVEEEVYVTEEVNETRNHTVEYDPETQYVKNTRNETSTSEETTRTEVSRTQERVEGEPIVVSREEVPVHGGRSYKGSEIENVTFDDGTVVKYSDEKNLAGCMPNPISKYAPATVYLKDGSSFRCVIHNEGNNAYQNYGFLEEHVTTEENVTIIDHVVYEVRKVVTTVTDVFWEVFDRPTPDPEPVDPENETDPEDPTPVDPTPENSTEEQENSTTPQEEVESQTPDEASKASSLANNPTGYSVAMFICALVCAAGVVIINRRK